MDIEKLKVLITADDSKFQKAIRNIQNSIKRLNTNNLDDGLVKAETKVGSLEKSYSKAMDSIVSSTKSATSKVANE